MGQGGAGNGGRPLLSYGGTVVQAGVGQQNKAVVVPTVKQFLFYQMSFIDSAMIRTHVL